MFGSRGPTIHIVDGDSALCDRLIDLAGSVGLRALSHATGLEFLNEVGAASPPACVVVNLQLPEISGLKVIRILRDSGSHLPAIAMSDNADVKLVVAAFTSGASEFLARPFTDYDFLEVIQDAVALYGRWLGEHSEREDYLAKARALTPRKKEIFVLMVAGSTNQQIASKVGIALKTVEAHRATIYKELQATSFAQLVRDATRFRAKQALRGR